MSFEDFKHAMDKWVIVFLEDRELPLLTMLDSTWHKLMAILFKRLQAVTAIGTTVPSAYSIWTMLESITARTKRDHWVPGLPRHR